MNDRWKRFGLTDCAVLIAALALGMALAPVMRPSGSVATRAGLSVSLGLQAAGPLILAAQWLRGRRAAPSPNELCWIASLVVSLLFVFLALFGNRPRGIIELWGVFHVCLAYLAVTLLLRGKYDTRNLGSWSWTDWAGILICIFVGFAIITPIVDILSPRVYNGMLETTG
jgi:hypothetical protein